MNFTYVESKKKNCSNELVYKTEIDLQTWKTKLKVTKGIKEREGGIRSLG